ncbi:hypothetical protein ALI144C_17085 [Actinosynnema sp. ALI-1.44]|uniref:hypothetical protein n=1 Tax=Actinosynnema sp. ALI-1.44 TaxID=1933779 RepID=UPI00097C6023|nr:hypothetical protein [Actinosynnema sp. ALI-1.44]ONI83209.1 hypothetical protein ALI144C_17085 [Actinosynnema sp. ALI-1.44]
MLGNGASRSFNGDGKPDLLVRKNATGEVFVLPHSGKFDGTSTFGEPVLIAKDMGWQRFGFLRAAQNGSGPADVIAFSLEGVNPGEDGEWGLFLYQNNGGLDGLQTLSDTPIRVSGRRDDGRVWETVALADVSGNGSDDTVSREVNEGNVDWFPHGGAIVANDTYDKTPHRLTTVAPTDFPFAMADFTGNGKLDLVVRRENGDIDIFEFADDHDLAHSATAGEGTWYTVAKGWNEYVFLCLTDIDLDGAPDLLVTKPDGTLLGYRNSGKFDPADPEALFEEPVVVGTEFWQYDVLS